MNAKQRDLRIGDLLDIRIQRNTAVLLPLKKRLVEENDPEVLRELKLTISYLEYLENPFSIEGFIPESLKRIDLKDLFEEELPQEKEEKNPLRLLALFCVFLAVSLFYSIQNRLILPGGL